MAAVVSIREVAAKAGVSLGTVSKVLNESAGAQIASATRERVRLAAQELGYSPNAVARALVRKQLDTIGVVFTPGYASPLRSPFFSSLFDGVLEAAAARGQNVVVFTGHTWKSARESLPAFRDGRCDGLLLFYQLPDSDIVPALLDARVPVVLVNDTREDERLTCVDVDNVGSFRRLTEHLIGLGHRNIALYPEQDHLNYVAPRREGFLQALRAAGLSHDPSLALCEGPLESVEEQLAALLARPAAGRPTAVACMGDYNAAGVIAAARRLGLRVPDDLSVAGFNDDGTAEREHVALTTARQPYLQIGGRAIDLLLEQMADIDVRGRRELLPAEIVVRETTAPPPPPRGAG